MIREKGFTAVEIVFAVAILGIAGLLGWKFFETAINKSPVSNASQVDKSVLPETLPELAELSTIKESALLDKPGVTVIHIELEMSSNGVLVYKAQLSDGSVVVYNARTGEKKNVLTSSEKSDEALPTTFTGGIGFARAIESARTVKPTGAIQKIELELEDGVVVYSVRFSDKARVDVHAESGEIVRTKAAKIKTNQTDSTPDDNKDKNNASGSSNSTKPHSTTPQSTHSDSEKSNDSSDNDHDDLSENDDDDKIDGSESDDGDDGHADDSSNSGSGSRH